MAAARRRAVHAVGRLRRVRRGRLGGGRPDLRRLRPVRRRGGVRRGGDPRGPVAAHGGRLRARRRGLAPARRGRRRRRRAAGRRRPGPDPRRRGALRAGPRGDRRRTGGVRPARAAAGRPRARGGAGRRRAVGAGRALLHRPARRLPRGRDMVRLRRVQRRRGCVGSGRRRSAARDHGPPDPDVVRGRERPRLRRLGRPVPAWTAVGWCSSARTARRSLASSGDDAAPPRDRPERRDRPSSRPDGGQVALGLRTRARAPGARPWRRRTRRRATTRPPRPRAAGRARRARSSGRCSGGAGSSRS